MPTMEPVFDLLLCVLLLGLVLRILTVPDLYQGAIFFIAFGLSMTLAWARLSAPDVALAEAAIGAGLLGVLLLDSLRVFVPRARARKTTSRSNPRTRSGSKPRSHRRSRPRGPNRTPRWIVPLTLATGVALAVVLTLAIVRMPDGGGLTAAAGGAMPDSGVEHPVTAVLLNFRGYDTWLEIGVLLLAMLGLFAIRGQAPSAVAADRAADRANPPDPLLDRLTRALVPLLVLASGYLLWLGKFAPGGAFQAGVVLGAAVILLRLGGFAVLEQLSSRVWRAALLLGFTAFLIHGGGALLAGRAFLEYPPALAGHLILVLEALAAFSIAFTLAGFFIVLHGADREPAGHDDADPAKATH